MEARRLKFLVFLPALILFMLGTNVLTPIWVEVVKQFNGTITTIGYAISIFSFTYAIAGFFWGAVICRYHYYKLFICVSLLLVAIVYLFFPFIHNVIQLYFLQFLVGLFGGAQASAYNSYFASKVSRDIAPLAWGAFSSMFTIGIALGALVGANIAHHFSLSAAFYSLSAIEFLAFIVALVTL